MTRALSIILLGLTLSLATPSYSLSLGIPGGKTKEIAGDKNIIVVRLHSQQNIEDLAQEYLKDRNQAWQIRELNNLTTAVPGQLIAIPLKPANPVSVYPDGYRTVPVLCYHQFSSGARASNQLAVSAQDFEQQMAYLAENNFQVIPLSQLEEMLSRKLPIPPKVVVLTIDDGYRSIYNIAYPILKKYQFPATVFLYTDFVGGSAALTWSQLKELQNSDIIDIQSHTKTHTSLATTPKDIDNTVYQSRIRGEISHADQSLRKKLGVEPRYLAYPYGDSSPYVIETLKQSNYALAVTVNRGSNPTFAAPYLLRRTMIYNNHTLDDFKSFLTHYVEKDLQ
ncbi:MAG: polysaccharide deacetylase family protein [Porticoccaceae bacterium]